MPGTLIEGKYEIITKIREGGMGNIYKVRHRLLDEIRVIKVMKPQVVADEDLKRRFVEEAKTATRLKHPNICTIHDFAIDDDGTAYLVMEFIDGANLADLLQSRGSPGLAMTLQIAHQSLLALGYLHRRNVVHRDVAPDNLMVTHDEEGEPRIKLIDLGIAKALDRTGAGQTSTGVFLGKLKYASPEQYGSLPAGERIDGRSDLYCLGVVLYELLTGTRPFVGETPAELLRAHLFAAPLPFEQTDPQGIVPPEIREVILKALEKKREDRFQSAEEFDREIVALISRFGGADLRHTVQLLSNVPRAPDEEAAAVTVTPSAQGRLDRQFGAQATPQPSRPTLISVPLADTRAGGAGEPPAPAGPARTVPVRRRWLPVGLLVVLGAALAALVWSGRSQTRRSEPTAPAATRGMSAAAAPSPASAPAVAKLEPQPTAAPPPAAEPTAVAKSETTGPPAGFSRPTVSEDSAERVAAGDARLRASRARAGAERAAAAEKAPGLFDFGRRAQDEGDRLLSRHRFSAARAAFDKSAESFTSAQAEALRPPARETAPAPSAAPAATSRLEPTRAAIVVATEAPAPVSPAPSTKAGPSEQDRIREVLHEYERAQSTLDPDLYARLYPSVDREKIRANFQSLRSQMVTFDIRKIEIAPGGASAVVRGHEKRTAEPRVGSEQRFSGERVIHLEKRGDSWVIVSLS